MARRRAHWGSLAALGTVVAWTPALAQTTDDVRHLAITTQVGTTYDSNVARASAAEAQRLNVSPGDVYVQPTVAIDALEPVGRESVFLTGSVGYNFYAHNTQLNRDTIDLTGGVSARVSRCLPQITGNYVRAQTQLEEFLPGPVAHSVSAQNVGTRAGVGVALSCPRAEGFSPTFSASHFTFNNSNNALSSTNYTGNSVMTGLAYSHSRFGSIQAFGNFTGIEYNNFFFVPFPPFFLKSNYDLYSYGVRMDRPIGSRLFGMVSVAYSSLRPATQFVPGFSGVTYNSELTYQMSPRLDFHVLVSRATLPTNQVGGAYTIDNSRQIDAAYSLGARLKLTVGGVDDPRSYQGGFIGASSGLLTSQRIDRAFGTLNIAVNRRVSVVLNAVDEHRTASSALFKYVDNRVTLSLRSVF